MKKLMKLMSVFMLICLGAFMLSGISSAQGKIDLQLKRKADGIVLQWTGDKNEAYSVYKKTETGKFAVINKKVKGLKYTDKDVKSGETYTYCVKLRKDKSTKSDRKTLLYLGMPVMKKTSVTSSGITLRWEKEEAADSYVIYRREKGAKAVRLVKTEKLRYFDKTAQTGVIYTYTVKGVKGKAVSDTAKVTVGRLFSPELMPVKKSADGLVVSWKKNDSAESYLIYRKKNGAKKWKKLDSVNASKLSYEDKKAVSGVKYSYFVRALSGDSMSLYEGKQRSAVCLKAPSDLKLDKSGKKITLSWKKSRGAEKYQLYKKVGEGNWKKLKETKSLSYTDVLKTGEFSAIYKVRAVLGKSKSVFSTEVESLRIDPKKPMVALTYDDGPHPIHTHRILDTLEKYGARATFFVVGSRITEYSDCLRRQGKLDCEVANHSYSHVTLSASSSSTVLNEIANTDRLIKKYSGQTPVLCRAPGGALGRVPAITGRPFVQWSVDTMDWSSRSCSAVVSHIKGNVRDGSIVLMHDLYGSTAAATEIIVPWLISQGYQLVTVSEMLEAKGIGIKGGRVYYNGYA